MSLRMDGRTDEGPRCDIWRDRGAIPSPHVPSSVLPLPSPSYSPTPPSTHARNTDRSPTLRDEKLPPLAIAMYERRRMYDKISYHPEGWTVGSKMTMNNMDKSIWLLYFVNYMEYINYDPLLTGPDLIAAYIYGVIRVYYTLRVYYIWGIYNDCDICSLYAYIQVHK